MPDFEERLTAIRNLIHSLPTNNFYLLRRICEHLERYGSPCYAFSQAYHSLLRITDFEEQNHMTAQALAVLFNPTLLRSPTNNFGELMHNMTHTSLLLQTLIIHVSWLTVKKMKLTQTSVVPPSIRR
jgi:GTPase-activating protein BEM2